MQSLTCLQSQSREPSPPPCAVCIPFQFQEKLGGHKKHAVCHAITVPANAVQTLQPCSACSSWDLKSFFLLQSDFTKTVSQTVSLHCRSACVSLDVTTSFLLSLDLAFISANIWMRDFVFPVSIWLPFQFSCSGCILLTYNKINLDWASKINLLEGFLIRVGV